VKSVTTKHPDVGYDCNVQIVAQALREVYDMGDSSYVMTAVAAHIWSEICHLGSEEKTWGGPTIRNALASCEYRLNVMKEAVKQ
jgi:hypothetical protein